jgi:two-component sensor histidine kinase
MKIFGESVLSEKFKALKEQFLTLKSLHLLYDQNFFSIDFKTITLIHPGRNQFAYKLEGLDKDWNYIGNRRTAYFTGVPPGKYTFRVKAANSDGIWNDQDTSLGIIVSPPWYATWWFYTFLGIILLMIGYSLYRIRINQILRLQAIRNRIASDLHDDIGSTLNSISIYSEVVKNELGKPSRSLEMIGESSRKVIDAMSDIVWTINPENDSFENIILRMQSLAYNLLRAKNIEFTFRCDESLNPLRLSMEIRKNFYLVFKEALNNIVKYSKAQNVAIILSKENNAIKLSIHDKGVGFDTSQPLNGNGINNMKRRAKEMKAEIKIGSQINEGTKIELSLKI